MTLDYLPHRTTPVAHAVPYGQTCRGSWSLFTTKRTRYDAGSYDSYDEATGVVALCWECGARWDFAATSQATEDPRYPEACERGTCWHATTSECRPVPVPPEFAPRLSTSYTGEGARRLGAWHAPRTIAGLRVYLEQLVGWRPLAEPWDDALRFLVADPEGNVLGQVVRNVGVRGGTVYHVAAVDPDAWRAVDDRGELVDFRTLAAAVKALRAGVL